MTIRLSLSPCSREGLEMRGYFAVGSKYHSSSVYLSLICGCRSAYYSTTEGGNGNSCATRHPTGPSPSSTRRQKPRQCALWALPSTPLTAAGSTAGSPGRQVAPHDALLLLQGRRTAVRCGRRPHQKGSQRMRRWAGTGWAAQADRWLAVCYAHGLRVRWPRGSAELEPTERVESVRARGLALRRLQSARRLRRPGWRPGPGYSCQCGHWEQVSRARVSARPCSVEVHEYSMYVQCATLAKAWRMTLVSHKLINRAQTVEELWETHTHKHTNNILYCTNIRPLIIFRTKCSLFISGPLHKPNSEANITKAPTAGSNSHHYHQLAPLPQPPLTLTLLPPLTPLPPAYHPTNTTIATSTTTN